MLKKLLPVLILGLLCAAPVQSAHVTKKEVLAAIAVLEKSVLSDDAADAARTVARFADESTEVIITLGPETMPWAQESYDVGPSIRGMLNAAYFAGNVKAQLANRRVDDDPYSGWLFVIKAYEEMRAKKSRVKIPEVEDLIEKQRAGKLKKEAESWRKKQEARRTDII